jgi:hypothetical protein
MKRELYKKMRQSNIQTKLELIDRKIALNYLKKNRANRNLSRLISRRYADIMRRDEWINNGQGIIFDDEGFLRDGQHRLQAVVEADTIIEINVTRGVPADAFDTVDTGKKRLASDALTMVGEVNTSQLAAALRLLYHYDNEALHEWSHPMKRASNRQILEVMKNNIGMRACLTESNRKDIIRFITPSVCATAYYIFQRIEPEAADVFLSRLKEGIGLSQNNPVYRLRELLINMVSRGVKKPAPQLLALFIKAWNLTREKKTTKVLMFRLESGEQYPRAI